MGGFALRQDPVVFRKFQHFAVAGAVAAFATAGFSLAMVKPALAEFQIQESNIEQGVELEYRGAYHWGIPKVTEDNQNANDLRQSHELEMQMGITNWWLIQVTAGLEQPLGENLNLDTIEIETEFSLVPRKGDGIGLAIQGGFERALNHGNTVDGDPNEYGFGPIIELAKGPVLLTLNPLFTKQVGQFADAESLGFQYGWRAEYSLNSRWGIGVEMFGEIEDLANAGSFNEQNHSIGPTLFVNFGGDEKNGKGGDDDDAKPKAKAGGGDDEKGGGGAPTEFSMNIGVQFGLTDATSEGALKVQGSLQF